MIAFVLITALAFCEIVLIIAGAVAWISTKRAIALRSEPDTNPTVESESVADRAANQRLDASVAPIADIGVRKPRRNRCSAAQPAQSRVIAAAEGCLLGLAAGLILMQLGFELLLNSDDLLAYCGAIGAAIGAFGAGGYVRGATALLAVALMIVVYTPVTSALIRPLSRTDVLHPAPAIVVLANTVHTDGSLGAAAQSRALTAYRLVRQGYAPRIVVAHYRAEPSMAVAMRAQLENLGLNIPVEETGTGDNTHDEAVFAARIARDRGWTTAILVTNPWHMRRAAATFEKAGLHVICAPCVEQSYDLGTIDMTHDRLASFRDWLHETLGYAAYRARGWL